MKSTLNAKTKIWQGVEIPYPIPMKIHRSELVSNTLKENPNHVVQISYDNDSEMTCEELRLKIIWVAQNLKKHKIKDGDVVGVVTDNSLDQMAFANEIIQLGAVVNSMSSSSQQWRIAKNVQRHKTEDDDLQRRNLWKSGRSFVESRALFANFHDVLRTDGHFSNRRAFETNSRRKKIPNHKVWRPTK